MSTPGLLCYSCCAAGGAAGMLGLTPDQSPVKDGVPLDPPPSTRQGFGRMQLTSSLPLSSNPPSPFRMQVYPCKLHIAAYCKPMALVCACIACSTASFGQCTSSSQKLTVVLLTVHHENLTSVLWLSLRHGHDRLSLLLLSLQHEHSLLSYSC